YDATTGKRLESFTGHDKASQVRSVVLSPDGELAALGCQDGTVRLVSVSKKEKVGDDLPTGKDLAVRDLLLTADQPFLITTHDNGDVKGWDLAKREAVHTANLGKDKTVVAFAVSPDGKRFATAVSDNVVKVWERAAGKEARAWDLHYPAQPTR